MVSAIVIKFGMIIENHKLHIIIYILILFVLIFLLCSVEQKDAFFSEITPLFLLYTGR